MEANELPLKPTHYELFMELRAGLIKVGYGCYRDNEIRNEMWRKMIKLDPRFKDQNDEGPTAVFTYTCTATKMTAKCCTSFALKAGVFKKKGYIFCLIEDENGKAVYWATLTKRTMRDSMIELTVMRAKICYERARARPMCGDPECRHYYDLRHRTFASGRKGYWWQCPNEEHHGPGLCPRKDPDYGLPGELIPFLEEERAKRERDVADPRRKKPRGSGWGNRQPRYIHSQSALSKHS